MCKLFLWAMKKKGVMTYKMEKRKRMHDEVSINQRRSLIEANFIETSLFLK